MKIETKPCVSCRGTGRGNLTYECSVCHGAGCLTLVVLAPEAPDFVSRAEVLRALVEERNRYGSLETQHAIQAAIDAVRTLPKAQEASK